MSCEEVHLEYKHLVGGSIDLAVGFSENGVLRSMTLIAPNPGFYFSAHLLK